MLRRLLRLTLSFNSLIIIFISQFHATDAFAWGERGHHVVCEVATRLVQNPDLKSFLIGKGHTLGHLCNIPDIYWRGKSSKDSPEAKSEDTSHFIQPDAFDIPIQSFVLSLSETLKFPTIKSTEDVNYKLGTLWWRVNQFFDLALINASLAKQSLDKRNRDDANKAIHQMIENLGLMGHFVGDASQPFHNTEDYDGWKTGNGGIHSYYETECVNYQDLNLPEQVYRQALMQRSRSQTISFQGLSSDKLTASILEKMKELSSQSYEELLTIRNIDNTKIILNVNSHSKIYSSSEEGREIRVKAKRQDPSFGAKKFRELIITQLARSSKLLALLWDEAYQRGGQPALSDYRGPYPITPEVVPVDYGLR